MANDGGPAFPVKGGMCFMAPPGTEEQYEELQKDVKREYEGMSLRDYAAIKFAASLLILTPSMPNNVIARQAFTLADAMIAERSKEAPNG
jgi:hypothetical protein